MTATNLGLETINSSDYVSPTPINNNMEKIDALGVDYIVEKGTSGEWWYRKWNSGRAECGIDSKQFAEQTMVSSPFGGYKTADLSFGAYPFAFSSRPYTNIVFEGDQLHSDRNSWPTMMHSLSTTISPNFIIRDANNLNMKPLCGIYVHGRYK